MVILSGILKWNNSVFIKWLKPRPTLRWLSNFVLGWRLWHDKQQVYMQISFSILDFCFSKSSSYYLMFKLLYLKLFTRFIFWPSSVRCLSKFIWYGTKHDKCIYVVATVLFLYMHTNDFELWLCTVTSEDICNYLKWDSSVAVYTD